MLLFPQQCQQFLFRCCFLIFLLRKFLLKIWQCSLLNLPCIHTCFKTRIFHFQVSLWKRSISRIRKVCRCRFKVVKKMGEKCSDVSTFSWWVVHYIQGWVQKVADVTNKSVRWYFSFLFMGWLGGFFMLAGWLFFFFMLAGWRYGV